MLRSYPWERRHPAGLPPEMAALPVRNISYLFYFKYYVYCLLICYHFDTSTFIKIHYNGRTTLQN